MRPAPVAGLFLVRLAGRTYLDVKVFYSNGKRKSEPNGKGVVGDCESEEAEGKALV